MNKYQWSLLALSTLFFAGGVVFLDKGNGIEKMKAPDEFAVTPPMPIPASPPITTPTPPTSILPYGKATLRVGETAKFTFNSITLLEVTEDSRCAEGVTCIWAGTLKAKILSVSGMGTSTETIELGKFITTEAEQITLLSADPYPKEGKKIAQNDYQLTFELTSIAGEVNITPTPKKEACYTGGCSGQICSSQPDMISTCEYRAEYACYKTATCERQASGECGWTETAELRICLNNPPSL